MMGRCPVHCPDGERGFLAMALAAVVAVYVLWQLAVILAVAAVAFGAVAALGAWLSRRLCWRLSVVYWRQPVERSHYGERITAALPAPRQAIEAPRQVRGVIIGEKEAVR